MKFKIGLYLNYTKKILRTPSRMALTLVGLVLSVIILTVGLIFSETYLQSKMADIDLYKQNNAFAIEGEVDYDLYNDIANYNEEACSIELVSKYKYKVETIKGTGKNVCIYIKDIRTNGIINSFMNCNDTDVFRYNAMLKSGRVISREDIENNANVTVISEGLAQIVFGDENPIGQRITFPVYKLDEEQGVMQVDYYEELEVVGVITDCDATKEAIEIALNEKEEVNEISFVVYTPLSYAPANRKIEDYNMRVTKYCSNDNYYDNVLRYEEMVAKVSDDYATVSYFSLRNEINSEIEQIRQMIFYIVAFMFVISGLCIVNTMFFSVKERINEIGIRKSIGAFDEDIIAQFVYEGLVYGFSGAIIGIILSVVIAAYTYVLMGGFDIWKTNLCISFEMILLSVCVSVTIGVIAGIIPSIYASRIKVTEAIKYD